MKPPKLNWITIASRIVRIVADTAKSLDRDSPGGKVITPEEREEILANAHIRFGGLLDDTFPSHPG